MTLGFLNQSSRRNPRARRYIRIGLILLLLGFILLNVLAALHAYRLTRFADYAGDRPTPETMSPWDRLAFAVAGRFAPKSRLRSQPDFPHESVQLTTTDGALLSAWKSAPKPSDAESTATVILCHGHGATRSALLTEAEFFRNLGFRVLMFDFRAHGESTGDVCSVGYYEAADVKAAWDHIRTTAPNHHIFIYGISMGAVAAARAVAEYDLQPAALILEMPFNRLLDAVRSRIRLMKLPTEPAATLLTFWGGVQLGFSGFDFQTSNYLRAAPCPILLQWGAADHRVSKEEILTIKSAAPVDSIHLEIYDGIGHSSLAKKANGRWTSTVRTWLTKICHNLPISYSSKAPATDS